MIIRNISEISMNYHVQIYELLLTSFKTKRMLFKKNNILLDVATNWLASLITSISFVFLPTTFWYKFAPLFFFLSLFFSRKTCTNNYFWRIQQNNVIGEWFLIVYYFVWKFSRNIIWYEKKINCGIKKNCM